MVERSPGAGGRRYDQRPGYIKDFKMVALTLALRNVGLALCMTGVRMNGPVAYLGNVVIKLTHCHKYCKTTCR